MTSRSAAWVALAFSSYSLAVSTCPPGRADQPAATATVQVPLHGAYVSDPVMSALDGKRLEERIAILERWKADQDAAAGKSPAKAPGKPDLLPLLARHCARCHSPGSAPDRGDGLVLFADDAGAAFARPMPGYVQTRVRQTVADGSMPKAGPKPSAAEKTQIAQFEVR